MRKTLGQTLKDARQLSGLTLRQVEEATEISNAYLSQLENDKIKKPSANFLYKLASIYKIDLETLLYASGIIKEKLAVKKIIGGRLSSKGIQLTPKEEEQLLQYLKFLRTKK
jgi:transcriptional regulator with XRE-family HTH domain